MLFDAQRDFRVVCGRAGYVGVGMGRKGMFVGGEAVLN